MLMYSYQSVTGYDGIEGGGGLLESERKVKC